MAQVTELYRNTWVIEDMGVRIFLLSGEEKALLIDTGRSALPLREIAAQYTDLPLLLLNTHADPDHISGNGAFEEFFMHPSEAIVYHNMHKGTGKLIPVYEGDEIDLGKRVLRILHVPGHTPGSITVLDKVARCLIGGDPIQKNGDIFMFGPHRDMEAYVAGLRHLLKFREEFDVIYPSHAQLAVGKDCIGELIAGAQDILAGKIRGEVRKVHGKRVYSCDAGVSRFLLEVPEAEAEQPQDILVRPCRPDDLPAMLEIWNEVVEEGAAFPQEDLLDEESGREFFAAQTRTGVAEQDGKIVGLYILHPNNVGRCGHIANASFAVAPGCRGAHIGEKLVKDCLEKGKECGFRLLQFNAVVENNVHARHLYERLGFVQIGKVPGGFRMKDGHFENIYLYYHTM